MYCALHQPGMPPRAIAPPWGPPLQSIIFRPVGFMQGPGK